MHRAIPGITIRPLASQQLTICLVGIHLIVFAVLIAAPMPITPRLMLLASLVLHAGNNYRLLRGACPGNIVEAHIESDGRTSLTLGDGQKLRSSLRPDTLVTPWVLVLRFDTGDRFCNKNLVIFNDALSGEERRLLRVLLRFARLGQ